MRAGRRTAICAAVSFPLLFGNSAHGNARGEFAFASSTIEGFALEAATLWSADRGRPQIENIVCRGDNQDLEFVVERNGRISVLHSQFLTDRVTNGHREHGAYLGDQLWLYIDQDRFELRNIGSPGRSFSNFPYVPNEQGEIILTWHGTVSVRRHESEAFRPLAGYYEQMVDARSLAWSLKQPDPLAHREEGVKLGKRYRIDNRGLKQAVAWCRQAVASPAAQIMPAELREQFSKSE
ncbi:MAG: hypothetical protein JSR28_17675 [Proteobacteria bacterium]|nr:hypothetical protein [Pseudomonadota bacterium]MDE2412554.1 hypothetical protein [Sphingomonadales bacterium]